MNEILSNIITKLSLKQKQSTTNNKSHRYSRCWSLNNVLWIKFEMSPESLYPIYVWDRKFFWLLNLLPVLCNHPRLIYSQSLTVFSDNQLNQMFG